MVRLAAALGLTLAMVSGPAMAGHFTHDRVIGFSEDGRFFAFKTFGLQRGSGLPYANLFVIDLERDAWVSGTPFRAYSGEEAMAEVEAAPFAALDETRRTVTESAAPMLRDLNIRRPATVLFAAGIGQVFDAPPMVQINVPHPDHPTSEPWGSMSLALETVIVPIPDNYCTRPEDLRGYRLSLHLPDAPPQVLHEDQRIPASRGCPEAYRLDAVLSAGYPQAGDLGVALISVWEQGFEGLSRHVIAVPVPMPERSSESGAVLPQTQPAPQPSTAPEWPSVGALASDFLGVMQGHDVTVLEEALRARQTSDPSVLHWPDADLSPATRAVELIAAHDGFSAHGRLWVEEEQVQFNPEGAGGPVTVSLVRVQGFNLGQARRADLMAIYGDDNVAPAEDFDIGPDIEWRFVMRPVQGMRADLVAAARREIAPDEAVSCGAVPCRSPDPLDIDSLPLECSTDGRALAQGLPTAVTTRLGAVMAALDEDTASADAWLIEHGLWQDDAMQVAALRGGQISACSVHLTIPD
ncbi:MAG: DUF2259 domain-containing protein [Pararhodobacter sp.]|nr:DUF2259 domain-containing protein [Pararhodobacter sp.]